MYCSECGTQLDDGASFCPECGFEIGSKPEAETSPKETAPCQKCDEEISTEAMKCPNCGWEPTSSGILGSLLALICIPWLGIGLLLYVGAFGALITGGYSIGPFFGGLLLITAFVSFPGAYLYAEYKNRERKPTEPVEIFGQEF
jgi:RNA polymerase subunit RPABC4/transcription elongation factor Spt4